MVSMLYWGGWGVGASLLLSAMGLGTLAWVFVIGAPVSHTMKTFVASHGL